MKVQHFDGGMYEHMCPGCNQLHYIAVDHPFGNGHQWSFNGDLDKPTFNPSINILGVCHYFITDGFIQFCSDSKHSLAGSTVELPELERFNIYE